MSSVKYKYASLEDYVISTPLSVDGNLDDGWGATFAVKGVETVAAVLFADMTSFSRRTFDLTPTETLVYVNNFFAWITAEALRGRPGIVDKYIGDEIMIVFSQDFGSADPFLDAVQTARRIAENDVLSFCPRIGIAGGKVTVGFVGTAIKYNCSVFGKPVALASRCAAVKPEARGSSSIIFPAEQWENRSFAEVFPPRQDRFPDGKVQERALAWHELEPRKVEMKNLPDIEIVEIEKTVVHIPGLSAEDRTRENVRLLKDAGMYRPRPIAAEAETM